MRGAPAGTGRPRCSGWSGARCETAVETVEVVGDLRARHGTGSSSNEVARAATKISETSSSSAVAVVSR